MNNETIGQTAEYALCTLFSIPCSIKKERINDVICESIVNQCKDFTFPKVIESVGYKNGSVDYICEHNETLSLKTLKNNDGKMCPQVIGQPTLKRWDQYWKLDFNGDLSKNPMRFEWIMANIHTFLNEMLKYIYCCDHLILISNCRGTPYIEYLRKIPPTYFTHQTIEYTRDVYEEKYNPLKQKYSEFSTTLKLDGLSIGELQFHKSSRKQVKFRFYKRFLVSL